MTKLILAFHNCSNAPKDAFSASQKTQYISITNMKCFLLAMHEVHGHTLWPECTVLFKVGSTVL